MRILRKIKAIGGRVFGFQDKTHVQYVGPFSSWDEAVNASVGYDSPHILEKVKDAVEYVLLGYGAYERDGCVFRESPKEDQLRSFLKRYTKKDSNIIDFGGGLGGTYINNRDLFDPAWKGKYCIIEQPDFCAYGKELSKKYNLPLIFDSSFSRAKIGADIIIFSSVLQYIKDWKAIVGDALSMSPEIIIVDRQPFANDNSGLYVQDNAGFYESPVSYPCWIVNKDYFLEHFTGYHAVEEWDSRCDPPGFRGILLEKDKN
jgi:putative methyltransferase (TIGR04325 family)